VVKRVKEIGWSVVPVSDRLSTFSFNRLRLLAEKENLKVIYGVEIGVVSSLGEKRASPDYWRFLAKDNLRSIHELVSEATANHGREPSLLYDQATSKTGVIKIVGSRFKIDHLEPQDDLFVSLDPSTSRGLFLAAKESGFKFIASSCNMYTFSEDLELYRIAIGWRSATQTYPQHILDDQEWWLSVTDAATAEDKRLAIINRENVFQRCNATMKNATILIPDKPKTLREMCIEGAFSLNVDLNNQVYAERLDRELKLIAEKNFEDYFYLVADIIAFAKTKMIVGPGRGSSSGSLVCYLLGITTVDPIPWDLVFERFIDVTRKDYPDIDIDFSETKRHLVFEYVEEKYGKDHAARLGTVSMFQSKSALNSIGAALKIPKWMVEKVSNSVIRRSKGDSRADLKVEDTLKETDAGMEMMREYPEASIVSRLEDHPSNAGQHAAGVVITNEPILEYVAVDSRTNAAMCDWQDAKDLNLLKLDALGLTQLSIFERTLELIGKDYRWLESVPLNDQESFDVINSRKFSGIFQFTGPTLQNIAIEVEVTDLEDIVAMGALCRPGPIGSGATRSWINRKNGTEKITVPHPLLEPYMKNSFGVMIYQEQTLRVGREVGGLSWADVTVLRKLMSKSMGKEAFDKYGDPWKEGAVKNGMPREIAEKYWESMCLDGDTMVRSSKRKNPLTIKQLYEKYELYPTYDDKRKGFKPSMVSLFPDGRGRLQKSLKIIKSGMKVCWRYTFEDGSHVVCTPDHEFIVNGGWKNIGEAKIGDDFLFIMDDYSNQAGRKRGRTGKGKGSGVRNKFGRFTGRRVTIAKEFAKEMKGKPCKDCGKIRKKMNVHHNDFVEGRKRPMDLDWLCVKDHRLRHTQSGKGATHPWGLGKSTTSKRLVKKKKVGSREVYDISMTKYPNFSLQNGLIVHNCSYGTYNFNRSHAVAYGLVSYYSCYLKAHYQVEFAAATLDAEEEPMRQIQILRELSKEGVEYIPVDPDHSIDKWVPKVVGENRQKILIGPLTQIRGIGPKSVIEILDARKCDRPIRAALRKKIEAAKTSIDSLYPVSDAVKKIYPDLRDANIITQPTPIDDIQPGQVTGDVVIICQLVRLHPLDENEPGRVAKRGKRVNGPSKAVNFFVRDDTGEIFCKISRWEYERLSPTLLNGTKQGSSLFAIKGNCPADFRMCWCQKIKYLGEPT
jgi:DNA polymerase III alpha subunit